jgi:ABC-2 type transport system ATP-binding protein
MSNKPVIEVSHITKSFGKTRALQGVSFQVGMGEIFGYLGPNGAGKTTTIRLILGLLKPNEGKAAVFGHDSLSLPMSMRKKIGVVLETDGIYDHLSVEQNLTFSGNVCGLSGPNLRTRIQQLLVITDLEERRGDKVGQFSKGMKRKVALARALLADPELLIFDELTAGLDPDSQRAVRELILKLTKEMGVTVFFSSHNLTEVQALCSDIGILKDGKLIVSGKRENIFRGLSLHPGFFCRFSTPVQEKTLQHALDHLLSVKSSEIVDDRTIRITLVDDDHAGDVLNALAEQGLQVERFEREDADLERAYFEIVGQG